MPVKKVLVALPAGMLEELDYIAKDEHRSRSDAIRESIRRYAENYKRNKVITIPKQSPKTFEKEIEELSAV